VLIDSNSLIMLAGTALMMTVMMGGLLFGGWTIFRRHRRPPDRAPIDRGPAEANAIAATAACHRVEIPREPRRREARRDLLVWPWSGYPGAS
jgi:hypothetical protein